MSASSLRKLAVELGLSATTISAALRGRPNVKSATRQRVLKAAELTGYRHNPLASALMTEMRRSRNGAFRGLLAILHGDSAASAAEQTWCEELVAGAAQRASELGFKADALHPARDRIELRRIPEILHARGIGGVLVAPSFEETRLGELDWSGLSCISAIQPAASPRVHTVGVDHHAAMLIALDELRAIGCVRPGLVLRTSVNSPTARRWLAAYLDFVRRDLGPAEPASTWIGRPSHPEDFARWLARGRHDAIITDDPTMLKWLRPLADADVDVGSSPPTFCLLGSHRTTPPCAGVDLRPRLVGGLGVELLIEQILRNERGEPEAPRTTLVAPVWRPSPIPLPSSP